jgi:2-keto-4-pentenoate hydratase
MDATRLANELIGLHDHARQVSPFSTRYPGLTAETGYAAARQLHAHRLAQGWQLVGRKNGFTNRGIWQRYGVNGPMWGAVYDRTVIYADNDHATVPLAGLEQPRIEPEICFRMKTQPPVSRDPQALLDCIDWVAHSVEIVQCHHPEWKMALGDCTANNALHGRLIVGSPVDVRGIADLAVKLPELKVKLFRENTLVEEGLGSNVLDSPLLSLAFLVKILAEQEESPPLAAGEIVSTGTLTDAYLVAPGERWSTAFEGLPMHGLSLTFER